MSYFHELEKWQGGFCNLGDKCVLVTSKHIQGMYLRLAQLICTYLEPLSKNRFFKILENGHFWPFLMHFWPKNVKIYFLLNFYIKIGRMITLWSHSKELT